MINEEHVSEIEHSDEGMKEMYPSAWETPWNAGGTSDLTIVTSDGQKIEACKIFLCMISSVFKQKLSPYHFGDRIKIHINATRNTLLELFRIAFRINEKVLYGVEEIEKMYLLARIYKIPHVKRVLKKQIHIHEPSPALLQMVRNLGMVKEEQMILRFVDENLEQKKSVEPEKKSDAEEATPNHC